MSCPFAHPLAAALLAAALGPAASLAAAAHCRPHPGEHQLARSAQAVVLATGRAPQTITGCSRRSGTRRRIAVLERARAGERLRLVGLHLAGTRVAYVAVRQESYDDHLGMVVTADDAIHGGRRHAVASYDPDSTIMPWWAVDADGDVAWLVEDRTTGWSLAAWRPGLGTHQIDARAATLDAPRLSGGVLTWRRDGAARSLGLAGIPRSACRLSLAPYSYATLDVELDFSRACLRATGQTVGLPFASDGSFTLLDANGPYLVVNWVVKVHSGSYLLDVATGAVTDLNHAFVQARDAVVDDHGSVAWTMGDGLHVRDAHGERVVPGAGSGPLVRDGSTVTWTGGGPTVTLAP